MKKEILGTPRGRVKRPLERSFPLSCDSRMRFVQCEFLKRFSSVSVTAPYVPEFESNSCFFFSAASSRQLVAWRQEAGMIRLARSPMLVSIFLFFVFGAAHAQQRNSPKPDPRPRTASISGRVTIGGKPAANAKVVVTELKNQ